MPSLAGSDTEVTVCGWLQSLRPLGEVGFGLLRDHSGLLQFAWERPKSSAETHSGILPKLPLESVLRITGTVRARPKGQQNTAQGAQGEIELVISSLEVLNPAVQNMPISIQEHALESPHVSGSLPSPVGRDSSRDLPRSPPSPTGKDASKSLNEDLRLKHRYLDLRRPWMGRVLSLRSRLSHAARRFLVEQQGFTEVETPLLFKSTPEGAAEFLVPTRTPGRYYALPQSPQQLKQMLMVGGVSRYFQIAKCFRDEGSRADRQPEFTQIDMEMSFEKAQGIMRVVEGVFRASIAAAAEPGTAPSQLPEAPLLQMQFEEAMARFGVDKPDLRFGFEIVDLTQEARAVLTKQNANAPKCTAFAEALGLPSSTSNNSEATGSSSGVSSRARGAILALSVAGLAGLLSRKELEAFQASLGKNVLTVRVQAGGKMKPSSGAFAEVFGDAEFAAVVAKKLGTKPTEGDILLVAASSSSTTAADLLGRARVSAAHQLVRFNKLEISAAELKPLWVTEFPLFDFQAECNLDAGKGEVTLNSIGLTSMHHPFTAPAASDLPALQSLLSELKSAASSRRCSVREVPLTQGQLTVLLDLKGQHYDLVCNGVELGGGSVRIHDAALQTGVLEMLGAPLHVFEHLLNALKAGAPPHGGLAIGFDRLVAVMAARMQALDFLAPGSASSASSPQQLQQQVWNPNPYGLPLPIREVIAFPKTTTGHDLMIGAPSEVHPEALQQYHIASLRRGCTGDENAAAKHAPQLREAATEHGREALATASAEVPAVAAASVSEPPSLDITDLILDDHAAFRRAFARLDEAEASARENANWRENQPDDDDEDEEGEKKSPSPSPGEESKQQTRGRVKKKSNTRLLTRSHVETLRSLWGSLAIHLEVHAEAEERILYPVLVPRGGRKSGEETEDAIRDHNKIRDAIRAAEQAKIGSEEWWKAVGEARKENTEHLGEEEDEALPDFRKHTSKATREEMGRKWREFYMKHPKGKGLKLNQNKDPEEYVQKHEK
jgi:aspartyl-tRNA synthetase